MNIWIFKWFCSTRFKRVKICQKKLKNKKKAKGREKSRGGRERGDEEGEEQVQKVEWQLRLKKLNIWESIKFLKA